MHQTIWYVEKIASVRYQPIDLQKCLLSIVFGEEGVIYQTLAGQNVLFGAYCRRQIKRQKLESMLCVADHVAKCGGNGEALPVLAIGDGSLSFSHCPKSGNRYLVSSSGWLRCTC